MKKLVAACLLALLISLLQAAGLPAFAHEDDGPYGEVQLIFDFTDEHEVSIVLPVGFDMTLLSEATAEIIGSPLIEKATWIEPTGEQVWLFRAPELLAQAGRQKQTELIMDPYLPVIEQLGLEGLATFVVVVRPVGLLNFDTIVQDAYEQIHPAGADYWELWWGFGLHAEGAAPHLTIFMLLNESFDLFTTLPLWLPLVPSIALAAWLLRLRRRQQSMGEEGQAGLPAGGRARIVMSLVFWTTLVLSAFSAWLLQWPAYFNYLLGPVPLGLQLSFVVALMLPAICCQLTVGWLRLGSLALLDQGEWSLSNFLKESAWFLLHWLAFLAAALTMQFLLNRALGLALGTAFLIGFVLAAVLLAWMRLRHRQK